MQVVALHAGVIVARSVKWQTTCTVLHHGGETFVVDSLVHQDELDALPGILTRAGWSLSGLLVTHADFDHLLARLVFPDASLGVAETTAARLRAEPGVVQRHLHAFDTDDYVARPRPLSLGSVQALPVPGTLELGADAELELIPADGHTQDGMAVWAPYAGVLCVGDYLSPVEIPWLSEHGSVSAYLATLRRLAPYVERAEWVVPGHGEPLDSARALAIMREDVAYLEALPARDAPLPLARRDRGQRKIHALNLSKLDPDAGEGGVHHVALEVRAGDLDAEVGFWSLLGFERVEPPAGLEGRAAWMQRGATQIHLYVVEEPVVPPGGHVAVVCPDYAEALARLAAAAITVEEREPHWGAPRCFARSPGGHRVEVMQAPPDDGADTGPVASPGPSAP